MSFQFLSLVSRIDAARRAVAKKHTNPSDILLQIDAKMESLTVQLSYEKKNLIKAVLREMNFSMKQKPGRTVMLMELCDLGVRNLNPRSIYNDLLSVDSDKVMSIHVVMYDDATKGSNYLDMSKHDMSVKLETGSPKIFYIGRLIDETLAFIDNFAAAKEAVIDASAAAAAAAKENVEQVYTAGSATRILLDINLKAPIIYIPRNEKSQQGLLADLGRLNLKNKFEKIHVAKESAYAISDRMDIQLTDMKLSRIYFDPQTQKLQSEVLLLDPVNLKLTMERNLSADWFHDVPNIGLIGTLRKAHIRASNEDYDVMMATLMENIAYAPDAPPVKVKIPIAASTAAQRKKEGKVASHSGIKGRKSSMTLGRRKTVSDTKATTVLMNYKKPPGSEETSRVSSSMTIVPPKLEPEPVYPSIKVRLDFPQLRIIMYQKGSVKLEECKGVVERKESTAFADFVILNVGVNFESWTNGSMVCPITVEDITLKDIRPGKRAVMNLIQRKLDYEDGVNQAGNTIEKALARFNYTVDVDENFRKINMLLETTSLTLVLCLDYLLQLLDFFSRSEDPGMKSEPAVKQERHPTTASSAIGPAREDVIPDDIEHEILPPEPALEEYFKGIYNFNETEIILVESMESVSSNALLLHCEVSLNQTATGGRSNMMGVVENFKLCTCKYNAENRYESMAEVISPTSVNMVMNTSEMVGTLIDINISDIFIRMTAGTLELLLKIVGTIGASGASGETDLEKKNYSDLWLAKKNEDMKFWFLNPDASVEVGLEALKAQEDKAQLFKETLKVSERLVLESGAIVFTFETGMGSNTMPMLLIETDVDMQVFDWSTNMTLAGRMKLEAAYYNATYGLWEFIVEPVETRHHGKIAHQPWELLFEYSSRINPLAGAGDEDELPAVVSNSYVSIALESTDILELTVTRTALDVIDILRDDFQAATKKLVSQKAVSTAAYSIVNDTGVDVKLYLKENGIATSFVLLKDGIEYEECLLKAGTSINLNLIESSDMTRHHASVLREQEGKEERILSVEIGDYGFKKQIPVNRACKRYYPLEKRQHGHVGLICDIWVKDCSKIVTLRGVVQIENGLQVDVDIYYKDDSGTKAILAGTAVAGQKFNLPITHTYTRSGELFFAPVGYSISSDPFSWLQALKELQKISEVKCESQTTVNRPNKKLFFIKVLGEAKQALHESTNRKNIVSQCCFIYLEPPLIINNLLPVSLSYSTDTEEESQIAEKGTSLTVTDIKASIEGYCKLIMKILDYTDQNWKSEVSVDKDTPEISHWTFTSEKDPSAFLTVGLHKEVNENEITWHFYMPYWMINRTGLELVYRGDDKHSHQVVHPKKQESPVLFSFPGKAFFSKKGACVKVKHINLPTAGSDWSEKFSLDVAGSGGSVKCMSPILHFELGVEIQLSSWGLTKYVIFSPRYYLVNQCGFPVSVREADKPDHVEDLNPNSCVPFWPESKSSLLSAILKTSAGVREETKTFRYDCVRHTLLQLNNHYGGVHVDVHFTEQKTVVTFSEFIPGQAPVLLVNGTSDCPIEVTEAGQDKDVFILQPRMSKLFTWKEPSGERILHWSSVGAEKKPQGSDKLYGDGFGTYTYKSGGENKEYYWISFLDGLQRVILFTPDVELATHLQAARENEIASAEYIIMLHGVGVSLVDNEKLKELMYLRIASSEISWESCKPGKKKRFKPMHQAENKLLEQAYQNYLNQKAIAEIANSKITLDSGDEIDFMTMKINKPYEKNLRRVFQTGIWVHYKMLPNSTQFHAKINRLQIDNQMHDSVFRVIFAPVVPPKSVTTAGELSANFG
jgi:vacuolar protein sorting-associated protein 13A/C